MKNGSFVLYLLFYGVPSYMLSLRRREEAPFNRGCWREVSDSTRNLGSIRLIETTSERVINYVE